MPTTDGDFSWPIGRNARTEEPVQLSHPDRFAATYIVGKMGMGKSTLIQTLVTDQLHNGDGCCVIEPNGCCVIEPKGDLVQDLLQRVPKARESDVVLLDYGDMEYPPGFDIFNTAGIVKIEEKAAYIREAVASFEKTLGRESWGTRMENLFMAVAATFTENPGSTLADIKRILVDDDFRRRCMNNLTSVYTQDAREFWERYDRMKTKDAYIDSTLTWVQRFLFDPILLAVTIQAGQSFDFNAAIHNRQIVLISLPERKLGPKGVDLLGTLYLSRIRLATQMQFDLPEEARTPFFVYLDEFQRFATKDIESFIAEARGAKVGLTMAHQWRAQIEDPGVRQAPMAAGNTIAFQVTTDDAATFARAFRWKEGGLPPFVYEEEPKIEPMPDYYDRIQRRNLTEKEWGASEGFKSQCRVWMSWLQERESALIHDEYEYTLRAMNILIWAHRHGVPLEEVPASFTSSPIDIDPMGLGSSAEVCASWVKAMGKDARYTPPEEPPTYPTKILYPHRYAWLDRRMLSETTIAPLDPAVLRRELRQSADWYMAEVWKLTWRTYSFSNKPMPVLDRTHIGQWTPHLRLGAGPGNDEILAYYEEYVARVTWLGDALAADGPFLFGPHERDAWRTKRDQAYEVHANGRDTTQEIAGALANLPRGEALAKLSQNGTVVEMKLKTLHLPAFGATANRDRIRERSRKQYCMPMAQAVQRMAERMKGATETKQEDDEMAFFDTPAPPRPPPRRGPI